MLFPVGVSVQTQRRCYVTKILVLFTVLVYFLQVFCLVDDDYFYFGVVPSVYTDFFAHFVPLTDVLVPLVSHLFLHGDLIHLILNMWVLWIFGQNLEDRLGHTRFFLCYLLWGFSSAGLEIIFSPYSDIPMIGASGAIAGIMGAYSLLLNFVRVRVLVFLLFVVFFAEIPSLYYFAFWFAMQLVTGIQTLFDSEAFSDVAWWGHIGGFVSGLGIGLLLKKKEDYI